MKLWMIIIIIIITIIHQTNEDHVYYDMGMNSPHLTYVKGLLDMEETNELTVVYDESNERDVHTVYTISKYAVRKTLAFAAIQVNDFKNITVKGETCKRFVVFCNDTNTEIVFRFARENKMLNAPFIWLFSTELDLTPLFSNETIGTAISMSSQRNEKILYSKKCPVDDSNMTVKRYYSPNGALINQVLQDTKSVKGCNLDVVITNMFPMASVIDNKTSGYDIDYILVLAEAMDVKLTFIALPKGPSGIGFDAMVEYLQHNKADLGLPVTSVTAARAGKALFSQQVDITQWVGVIKVQPMVQDSTKLFAPLHPLTWIMAITSMCLLTICHVLINFLQDYPADKLISIRSNAWDKCFYMVTAFLQQDVLHQDRLWNGRIFQCTMSITSFIIFIAHSSVLVAFLSSGKSTLPFQSLEELLDKPYFKMYFPAGSAISDSFQNAHKPNSIFLKLKETIFSPCGAKCVTHTPNELYGIALNTPYSVIFTTETFANVKYDYCNVTQAIRNKFLKARLVITMKKAFLYSHEVNRNIIRLKEFGITHKIFREIHTTPTCPHRDLKFVVGLENIYLILIAHSMALITSIFVLFVESFVYYKTNIAK